MKLRIERKWITELKVGKKENGLLRLKKEDYGEKENGYAKGYKENE